MSVPSSPPRDDVRPSSSPSVAVVDSMLTVAVESTRLYVATKSEGLKGLKPSLDMSKRTNVVA